MMNPWILGGLAGLAGMALAGRGSRRNTPGGGGGYGDAIKPPMAHTNVKMKAGGNGKLVREVPVSWTNSGDPTIPGWTLVGFKKNYYGPDWLIYRPKGVAGNQWNHILMVG
jgi:hypothetical protein